MTNKTIYPSQHRDVTNFRTTCLYIKQHKITGLLYFGKTVKTDIHSYYGSGKRWNSHLKRHGYDHVETIWYCYYNDPIELEKQALSL